MAPTVEAKTLRIKVSTLVTVLVGLVVGFWAFYTYNTSNLRNDFDKHLQAEVDRMHASVAQAKENNSALLESLRREKELAIASDEKEHAAKLRETDLLNQANVARIENKARQEQELLTQSVDRLRHQLSVSRNTLEIRTSDDFISISDLLIGESEARERMAAGAFTNVKRMLLPDFRDESWRKFENISITQVDAFIREKTIKLPPEDYNPNEIEWQPLFTIWAKDSKGSVGVVGAAQLSLEEFTEVLQKGNTTTTTSVKSENGQETKETKVTTVDAKKLSGIPLGLSAYAVLHVTIFTQKNFAETDFTVKSFSARSNAMHFSGTITPLEGPKFDLEMLVMQDATHVFILFDSYSTENALDPVSRETADWLRRVRFVK